MYCDICGKIKTTGGYCRNCRCFTPDMEKPPKINSHNGYTGACSSGSCRTTAKLSIEGKVEPIAHGRIVIIQHQKGFKSQINEYKGKKLTPEENLAERKRLRAQRRLRKKRIAKKAAKEA